jgi:hypothetical protein
MTRKNTLFLHIGSRKTGTTALQEFFAANRTIMKKQGILYPDDGGTAHHRLAQSLLQDEGNPWWFPKNIGDSAHEWKVLLRKLKASRNLISSEFFFRCKRRHILKIYDYTRAFDVKIVAYLRRQDEVIQSEYNQKVKGGPRGVNKLTFDSFLSPKVDNWLFHYDKVLDQWADIFGKGNIIVRPYEKNQFYHGNIFEDFFHFILDSEITPDFTVIKDDPNPRLHRVALEYKRLVNILLPSELAYKSFRPALLKVSEALRASGKDDPSVASPHACLAILETFSRGNERIARDYLGRQDGRLFVHPLPDINQSWLPYHQLQKDDARYINHFLCKNEPALFMLVVQSVARAHCSGDSKLQEAAQYLLPGIADSQFESGSLLCSSSEKCLSIQNQPAWNKIGADIGLRAEDKQPLLRNLYNKIPARLKPYIRSIARIVSRKKRRPGGGKIQ